MKRIRDVVVDSKNFGRQDELVGFLCGLNGDLKNIHSTGKCIGGVSIDSVIDEKKMSFINTSPITSSYDVKEDLESFAIVAISSFVYMNSGEELITLNKEVILENSDFISSLVPSITIDDRYYVDTVKGEVSTYYSDYLNNLSNQVGYASGNTNSNVKSYSYSTPAGRAMARDSFREKNLDRAFVDIMFYPIIVASAAILFAVIYIVITVLV